MNLNRVGLRLLRLMRCERLRFEPLFLRLLGKRLLLLQLRLRQLLLLQLRLRERLHIGFVLRRFW